MNRQIIEQIRDHHAAHIAWVKARGLQHIDLDKHQRWVDEMNRLLESEWFTPADVFNALSASTDARRALEAAREAA